MLRKVTVKFKAKKKTRPPIMEFCTDCWKCGHPIIDNKCGKFPESEANPMPDTPKLITDLCDADLCETDELYSWGRELLRVVDFSEREDEPNAP